MKRALIFILVLVVIIPSFVPWLPHDALRAMHDNHMATYHSGTSRSHHDGYTHQQNGHEYTKSLEASDHHLIQIDAISFLNDYLHIDLQQPNDIDLTFSEQIETVSGDLAVNNHFDWDNQLKSVQSRGPPNNVVGQYPLKPLPIYLSSQRIRV